MALAVGESFALRAASPEGASVEVAEAVLAGGREEELVVSVRDVLVSAVSFETGEPVAVRVRVTGTAGGPAWPVEPTPLDTHGDGDAVLRLPEGRWRVAVTALDGGAAAAEIAGGSAPPDERTIAVMRPRTWLVDHGPEERGPATVRWSARNGALEAEGRFVLRRTAGLAEVPSLAPPGRVRLTVVGGEPLWEGTREVELVPGVPLRLP